MKNLSMFIRGAIGIKKGLGRDEIEFDLKDKTGLIALAGPNGKGKSTFLELMSLYRTLASRKGSLKHHFCLRDSRVEHKFLYDGDEYHLIWKIDSGSDRSEAFILINGESVVNGKNTEYDKFINEKFGSPTLFYSSVFCAQGSGNLSTMTTGKIKELFVEFLRIERLAEYEKDCKPGIAYFHKKSDVLSGKIENCKNELEEFKNIESEIKDSDLAIENKNIEIGETDKKILTLDITINDLTIKSEKQKADLAKKTELETELKKLITDRDQAKVNIEELARNFESLKSGIDKDMDAVNLILADKEKIFKASSRISNLGKWEKYFSECFECAIEEQARFDKDIKDVESRKNDLMGKISALENDLILDGLKTTLNYLDKRKFDLDSNHSILTTKLKAAGNDFTLLQATNDVTACKEKIAISIDPDCISTICPALKMVSEAKAELPRLEKIQAGTQFMVDESIKNIEASIKESVENLVDLGSKTRHCIMDHESVSREIAGNILSLQKEVDVIEATKKQLLSDYLMVDEFKTFYKSKIVDTRALIFELKELSAKKPQIEIAEEKIRSFTVQSDQLKSDFDARKKGFSDMFDSFSVSILEKEGSISKINSNVDIDIDKKRAIAETDKEYFSNKKNLSIIDLEGLKDDAAILRNNKTRKENLSKNLESCHEKEKTIKKELSEWEYLRLACSKTGLQALEIDGAAPLITAEANTLLEKAFGLDSQIKIVTQDPETGKEVFWIKVIREDGAEDDFANLSGGQKVWISEALSKGMTLVSKRKSGRNFESLYSDENDGALDSDKALDFMKMKRAMMDIGGFSEHFFVSHNPDVVGMADHVIDFGKL